LHKFKKGTAQFVQFLRLKKGRCYFYIYIRR